MKRNLAATTGCLCLSARRLSRVLTQLYDEHFQEVGLTVAQFSLLSALSACEPEGARLGPLAAAMDMDPSTLTRNLQLLCRDKLVRVAVGTDRRQRRAVLTPAGQAKLRTAQPLWTKAQNAVRKKMGADAGSKLAALVAGARELRMEKAKP